MKNAGIHTSFTFDGKSFNSETELLEFMDRFYPKGKDLIRSWFGNGKIEVKTSGSTGAPKTLVFSREQMRQSALATGSFFGVGPGSKALLCLPLEYIAGKMMLIRAMTLGWQLEGIKASIHLDMDSQRNYDFAAMIPLQLENNLKFIGKIRTLIVGGASVSWKLQHKIESAPTRVYATYGMTETLTHVAVRPLNISAKQEVTTSESSDSVQNYTSLPGVSFRQDKRGCLVIHSPRIAAQDIVTNDLVDSVSEKSFNWLGRIDNVINSGGLKLMPETIEHKFSKHISNRFFAAGVPDDQLGQRMIFVVEGQNDPNFLDKLKDAQDASEGSILKHEVPKEVVFLPEFEETDSKKIHRHKTLELFIE